MRSKVKPHITKYVCIILAVLAFVFLAGSIWMSQNKQVEGAQPKQMISSNNRRVLIVYFSWSGNTEQIALALHKQVGGSLIQLKAEVPYSSNYDAVSHRAGKEYFSGASPKVATKIPDLPSYTDIFIGYPIWYGTAPMLVKTFLQEHSDSEQNFYPFATSSSDGIDKSLTLIRKAVPNANVASGLRATNGVDLAKEVSNWLQQIGYL